MKTISIEYYAYFRERRGLSQEDVKTDQASLGGLYEELSKRHGFSLPASSVRPAVNDAFKEMSDSFEHGDTVVFVPPVAGG